MSLYNKTTLLLLSLTLWLTASTLTFEQALTEALHHNLDIKGAHISVEKAQNSATLMSSGLLPTVAATAGVHYSNGEALSGPTVSDIDKTTSSAGIQLSYTLFDGFYTLNNHKISQKMESLSKVQRDMLIETTLFTVAQNYISLITASESVKTLQESIEVSKKRLALEEKRKESGLSNSVDYLSAQIDLKSDSTALLQAEEQQKAVIMNMNTLMGREAARGLDIDTTLFIATLPSQEEIYRKAKEHSLTLQSIEHSKAVSELQLKMAKSAFQPRINLTTGYSYSHVSDGFGVDFNNDPQGIFTTGLNLTWYLFDGRAIGTYKNTKRSLEENNLQKESLLLNLQKEVRIKFNSYTNALEIVKREEQNVALAKLNLTRSEELYKLGQISSTSFRDVQLMVTRVKQALIQARGGAKIAELNLLKLSGELIK